VEVVVVGFRHVGESTRREIRLRVSAGERYRDIAWALAVKEGTVRKIVQRSGGMPPRDWVRSESRLSLAEREEISRGLTAGLSLSTIARQLGRVPSTVTREVAANGGRRGYRAWSADRHARARARRPKPAKLAACARLRKVVEEQLELRWSPQQIARRLREDYPSDPEMWVSHETIYQSLFVQGRGALRKELHHCLRSGRAIRKPRRWVNDVRGHLPNMVMISERPAEIEDRAVPGHWEGDLIIGKNSGSAIGTLVERSTRYVMLFRLPDGRNAEHVRSALTTQIMTLPQRLRRSVTWDQGKEMHEHAQFTIDTGIQVYFCDPHSPWQRGSNENTNGLLRQYFPKGTDLTIHSQADLDRVAHELNGRPRQTLSWMKPCERLAELVATTA
jgi:transposase, IS30 family